MNVCVYCDIKCGTCHNATSCDTCNSSIYGLTMPLIQPGLCSC